MISVGKSRADAVGRYCFPPVVSYRNREAQNWYQRQSVCLLLRNKLASSRCLAEPRQMGSAGPTLGTLQMATITIVSLSLLATRQTFAGSF
jgi:hypothetical protein